MRKVLSFVLVLSLVLSSFSMAFAATPAAAGLSDIAGNANKDAIQVCFDLGIVTGNPDGTFTPAKAVNRAEFAAMLTRALHIPDSALAGYTTASFKDTAGYAWAVPYLAFCQSKGILLGDGAGNVMPGKTITVNEAMTMALRAIGYTANSSLLVGAWPSNYVSLAQNNDMYDDVATTTTVDKASAAQIIYNLLTVQKVAVNSDGATDYLWDGKESAGVQANLLNTNLNCKEHDNVILGDSSYDYDNAVINITEYIGAYGDVYTNKDGDIVAFTKHDCETVTGKINDDGDFEVGDTSYEFGTTTTTTTALFANTDYTSTSNAKITKAAITDWASKYADDGKTVTLNADISGKKIKDIYSVVAWSVKYNVKDSASVAKKAPSDVQTDIADKELAGAKFIEDDDKNIDKTSFELVGVASLDKIAKDNVLYVYTDKDGKIRKVAVGTETIKGTVDEVNVDDETVTIAGKEYDMAPYTTVTSITVTGANPDIDESSEGTFYLDAFGKIYDFDGSSGTDTFAVVKNAKDDSTGYDNFKVKLYKSDDSDTSYNFAKSDPLKIDWVTRAGINSATDALAIVKTGALVGYTLNNSGEVKKLDVSYQTSTTTTFQSIKVLKVSTTSGVTASLKIESDAPVFTYKSTINNYDDYDICKLADVETGAMTGNVYFILNEDGNVAALFIEENNGSKDQDDIYGVFNKRSTAKDSSDDKIYKFKGFIDGTAFSYSTDDDASGGDISYDDLIKNGVPAFGVYAISLDSSNQITKVKSLGTTAANSTLDIKNGKSGLVKAAMILKDLDDDNTVMTFDDNSKYSVEDKAIVYKYDKSDKEFSVSKLSNIDDNDTVALYDTKGKDADGIANVVIFIDN